MPATLMDDLTVGRVPRHAAGIMPGKCALDDGRRTLSFGELDEQADRLASALAGLGACRGEVVCAYLPNCIDYVLVVLAVARAGAVFSPINPRFKAREVAALLRFARPRAIFTTAKCLATIDDAAARVRQTAVQRIVTDAPRGAQGSVLSLAQLIEHPVEVLPAVAEADYFSLMFTSGTTGKPKGVLATHRARMLWVLNAAIHYGLTDTDRYLGAMPLAHSAGLTFTLIHLYVGATVRILDRFDAIAFLNAVEREKVSSSLLVPTMLAMILDALDKSPRPYALSSLKRVVTCGSPLSLPAKRQVIERISDQLYDYYGSTESNSMTVLRPRDQLRKPDSVGQPFANVEIMIAGPDGETLAPNQTGEVWCSNPSVMASYRDRPEETAAAFTGRWFHTGDLGYRDEEGFLYLTGRANDMIISGGVNIFPVEIERVIMLHPAVLDCTVVGVPDPKWGQGVKAFVVLRNGRRLTLAELQKHCMEYLAGYKKPRSLEILDHLPKNAGGKTVKSALPEPARKHA